VYIPRDGDNLAFSVDASSAIKDCVELPTEGAVPSVVKFLVAPFSQMTVRSPILPKICPALLISMAWLIALL
jgi:hypothetical protein